MRDVTCPRGRRIDSTADGSPGVLCTVIAADNERDAAGVSGSVDPVLRMSGDPSSIVAFCTGRGIPGDGVRLEAHGHAAGETTCYTDCPVFRAEVERSAGAVVGARLSDPRNTVVEHRHGSLEDFEAERREEAERAWREFVKATG